MGEAIAGTFGTGTIKGTGISLIVLTSLVVGTRFAGLIRSFKDLKAEDYLLIVAYIFFLELSILYIYIAPAIFRIAAVSAGTIPPYATISEYGLRLQTVFFVTTSSLWLCLWMVKFSLMAMYKRLLVGKKYIIAWWVIMGFCQCDTPRDHRAAVISLYYAYGVDIATDLAIMILPIRLIWNLQMKTRQKLSIGGLFCFGWICIIVSTIRVVQLGETENGVPAPSWLALWGTIEALIAVMIGCCPGLYRVLKNAISPSKTSYPYDSYNLRGRGGSGMPSNRSGAFGRTDIPLNSFRGKEESYQSASAYRSTSPSSSQEKLADLDDRRNIMVNYGVAVTVENRPRDYGQATRFV
ncbi:Pc16g03020 [Penicillium rubens Wisconsin 54-1255]|uniref:Pc16g03020 protein n=1 Tax=Penicillium rubens (strain ATCC 28089 / DSM 1075 / NRRL 1951 / Wisconsin 54-1255) TaxID=500485 RepID=B6H7L6_PENRW|nr:Pc16g03020 [Penicillium rubens Wisconsin 54-1255]